VSEVVQLPYMYKAELLQANEKAVQMDYSAYCNQPELMNHLMEGFKYPVTASALDGDGNMVCRILVGPEDAIFVALTQASYNALPTVPVDMVIINAMAEALESPKH